MTTMNLTAYAATHGVTKQSAAEWKAKGYLVLAGELVDVEASDARMEGAGKGRFRVRGHGGKREKGVRGKVDRPGLTRQAAPALAPAESAPEPHQRYASEISASMHMLAAWDRDDAEAFLECIDNLQWTEMDQDREMIRWRDWPAEVAPAIAAAIGSPRKAGQIATALCEQVLRRLLDLTGESEDGLARIEAELKAAEA